MPAAKEYPPYVTYDVVGRRPSMLLQAYPRPTFNRDENYYPINALLSPHFASEDENRKFGAATFCAFLEDTVEVEHCLVIPAIVAMRRVPYVPPPEVEQDLYKIATDEGYHAEQAFHFLADLRGYFGLTMSDEHRAPLFLRRLDQQRAWEPDPVRRDLITVMNGVVTETRISIELGKFASDSYLGKSVRELCHSHAEDEQIHSSQFRALGRWLWESFDADMKAAAAKFMTDSTIARSIPDVARIARLVHQATGRSIRESRRLVYSLYNEEILLKDMLVAAQPTVSFFKHLGVGEYEAFEGALERETQRLAAELAAQRVECS